MKNVSRVKQHYYCKLDIFKRRSLLQLWMFMCNDILYDIYLMELQPKRERLM